MASPVTSPQRERATLTRGALRGGRVSLDSGAGALFGSVSTVLAPNDANLEWRRFDLDAKTLDRVSPTRLAELLADLSPDVSRALWDLARMVNPGWEVQAFRPGSESVDKPATAAVSEFLDRLDDHHGAVDVVWGRLTIGAFLRGAFCGELVLDQSGRLPIDLVTPDPASVRFDRTPDPERGSVWRPFQWQAGKKVFLDIPTFRYVPIDPFPGSPYGRPLVSPAVFSTLFLLGLLHDLRRVVAQQGWPRIDVAILMDKLQAAMPVALESDPQGQQDWLDGAITDVQAAYRSLQPDDAYVHPDLIQVNRPVGTVDSSSLGAVDGVIKALERMSVRALKTLPLLMGTTEGTSEAQANRQWELYAAGIKSLQHYLEAMLERLLGLALQAQGMQATVQFRFAELRASEWFRDAQTERLEIDNATARYQAGWISQDEAAQQGAYKPKADHPEPRGSIAAGEVPDPGQADPGENRAPAAAGRRNSHGV